jgi:SAM-dependent methyltransferase
MVLKPNVTYFSHSSSAVFDRDKFLLMKRYLPKSPSHTIYFLDLGCGEGHLYSLLKQQCYDYKYLGLEFSQEQVKKARRDGIPVRRANLNEKFPLPNSSFDIILASEILEHIYDPEFFLEEIHRVLKPDGILFLTTPNIASLGSRLKLLFGIRPAAIDVRVRNTSAHIHGFTISDLKALFSDTDFTVRYVTGTDFYLPFLAKDTPVLGSVCLLLARLFPTLSAGFFFVCTLSSAQRYSENKKR